MSSTHNVSLFGRIIRVSIYDQNTLAARAFAAQAEAALVAAETASDIAGGFAGAAEDARDVAIAAGPYYLSIEEGEDETVTGDDFAVAPGDGTVKWYRRTIGGSEEIFELLTQVTDLAITQPGASVTETLFASARKTASLRSYGAIGGDVTSGNLAMAAALANNDNIFIDPTDTPFLVAPWEIAGDGQRIYGAGEKSCLQMNAGSTGDFISTNGHAATFRDFKIFGGFGGGQTNEDGPISDRSGLAVDYDKAVRVSDVIIQGFGNFGLTNANAESSVASRFEATNLNVIGCFIGVNASKAEYTRWTNPSITGCRRGFDVRSGNVGVIGGILTYNGDNAWVYGTGDANNSHGGFIGTLINHAQRTTGVPGYAVLCEDVSNGHFFVGCQMFYGIVRLINSNGVNIVNGGFDIDEFQAIGSGRNFVKGNYCDEELDNIYSPSGTASIIFDQNRRPDGTLVLQNAVAEAGMFPFLGGNQLLARMGEPGSFSFADALEIYGSGASGIFNIHTRSGGALATNPLVSIDRINSRLGFFGATPAARQTLAAAATDAATTQALANSLRTALINLGLGS